MVASARISILGTETLLGLAGIALTLSCVACPTAHANGLPAKDPDSGHLYTQIGEPLSWPDAKAAAEAITFPGLFCHLAVITSQEENDFVQNVLPIADTWIGGERLLECPDDSDSEEFWGKWVTGELWDYTNWNPEGPDECEDSCLMYTRQEEEEETLGAGGGAQLPAAVWDEEDCDEDLVALVECEPEIGAPTVSPAALAVLFVLMTIGSGWLLRRRQRRLAT